MTAPPTHKGEKLPPEPAEDTTVPRKTITQPDAARAENSTEAELRETIRALQAEVAEYERAHELMAAQFRTMQVEKELGWQEADKWEARARRARGW